MPAFVRLSVRAGCPGDYHHAWRKELANWKLKSSVDDASTEWPPVAIEQALLELGLVTACVKVDVGKVSLLEVLLSVRGGVWQQGCGRDCNVAVWPAVELVDQLGCLFGTICDVRVSVTTLIAVRPSKDAALWLAGLPKRGTKRRDIVELGLSRELIVADTSEPPVSQKTLGALLFRGLRTRRTPLCTLIFEIGF